MNKAEILNILCVTDNLGSGGAQRQITLLSIRLRARGHNVTLITYNSGEFFVPALADAGIRLIRLRRMPKWARPLALAKIFRQEKPEGVIAFQEAPSFYSELASAVGKRWRLIVSERTTPPPNCSPLPYRKLRRFHALADVITTNSHTNRREIERTNPSLRNKTVTIYNAVDLDHFKPAQVIGCGDNFNLVAMASHKPVKNFEALARALVLLKKQHLPELKVDWYGDEAAPGWLRIDQDLACKFGVQDIIHFHPATRDVPGVLNRADALIHSSLWEGLPNAVCEALAAGCPVLASHVCDATNLVMPGRTGFLFDPTSPDDIARSISAFLSLSSEERMGMRLQARVFAERLFDPERYAAHYERLLLGIIQDPDTGERHWPSHAFEEANLGRTDISGCKAT